MKLELVASGLVLVLVATYLTHAMRRPYWRTGARAAISPSGVPLWPGRQPRMGREPAGGVRWGSP